MLCRHRETDQLEMKSAFCVLRQGICEDKRFKLPNCHDIFAVSVRNSSRQNQMENLLKEYFRNNCWREGFKGEWLERAIWLKTLCLSCIARQNIWENKGFSKPCDNRNLSVWYLSYAINMEKENCFECWSNVAIWHLSLLDDQKLLFLISNIKKKLKQSIMMLTIQNRDLGH